jgi:intergrase/recombinase
VQHHALTALANLAKYTGRYQKFLEIRQRYNLKWSRGDPMTHFERFFNEELTLDVMLQRIKEMIEILPVQMGKIIKFGCLVGLRASEVIESVRLLNSINVIFHVNGKNLQTQEISYYNPKRQALEHFRYKKQFIRQTKKAYISFLTPEMLSIVQNLDNVPTKNAITHACQRRHIPMDMYLTRKIFASWLRKEGIQPEVVDMLQGRVSQSILMRHYLVPSSTLKDDVLASLYRLQRTIEQPPPII